MRRRDRGDKPPGCKKNSGAEGEECEVVEGMCVLQ